MQTKNLRVFPLFVALVAVFGWFSPSAFAHSGSVLSRYTTDYAQVTPDLRIADFVTDALHHASSGLPKDSSSGTEDSETFDERDDKTHELGYFPAHQTEFPDLTPAHLTARPSNGVSEVKLVPLYILFHSWKAYLS